MIATISGGMVDALMTMAEAAAVAMAAGGAKTLGDSVGKAGASALTSRIAELRQRFRASGDRADQMVLAAAENGPDEAAVHRLAAVIHGLAQTDDDFSSLLHAFDQQLERARPGGTVQVAQKISNFHGVTVSGDFNLNM
jgi:hypothetical protein